MCCLSHGLRTPREEIAFTARPKIHSHSQIYRYGGSIFCLPHRPNFSDIFDLCLHWVSVVRGQYDSFDNRTSRSLETRIVNLMQIFLNKDCRKTLNTLCNSSRLTLLNTNRQWWDWDYCCCLFFSFLEISIVQRLEISRFCTLEISRN